MENFLEILYEPCAAHGIKKGSIHLERMPKTSQSTIHTSCASSDPKTVKTMLVEASQATSTTRNKTQTRKPSSFGTREH